MYRIIYMGTPDFAVPCLAELVAVGADICCVVTQPDKPVGRKQILTPPPVKVLAMENGLPVYQPQSLKTQEAYETLSALQPDFIVVAAYGKILPKPILDIPKIACVNVHGSLLPEYRGAAPIQRAVYDGKAETGITTMLMGEGLDTGDILLMEKTRIGEKETAGELFDRLASMSPALLLRTLDGLAAGTITPVPQDESRATYAPMLSRETAVIDWNQPAKTIECQVRGLNPWPVASMTHHHKRIKIYACEPMPGKNVAPAGVLFADNGQLFAGCADGCVHITDLQAEGSKRMNDRAYLNGHSLDD